MRPIAQAVSRRQSLLESLACVLATCGIFSTRNDAKKQPDHAGKSETADCAARSAPRTRDRVPKSVAKSLHGTTRRQIAPTGSGRPAFVGGGALTIGVALHGVGTDVAVVADVLEAHGDLFRDA